MLDEWEAMAQRQRELAVVQHERERRTLVQLLDAAGQPALALVVAGSEYRSDCVDNWDRGQCEVTLGVPPEHVFNITDEHRQQLEKCLQVIVGDKHYRSVTVGVRLAEHQPRWDVEFAQRLWSRLDGADSARTGAASRAALDRSAQVGPAPPTSAPTKQQAVTDSRTASDRARAYRAPSAAERPRLTVPPVTELSTHPACAGSRARVASR